MYCSFFTGTVYGYPTVGMMSLGPAVQYQTQITVKMLKSRPTKNFSHRSSSKLGIERHVIITFSTNFWAIPKLELKKKKLLGIEWMTSCTRAVDGL